MCRCFMTTGPADVAAAVDLMRRPSKDAYGFGVHPWNSHLFYVGDTAAGPSRAEHYRAVLVCSDEYRASEEYAELVAGLPEPRSLEEYVQEHFVPHVDRFRVIGEVGLDKQFRVQMPATAVRAARPRNLSRCRVAVPHQRAVLHRMLELAVRHGKSVSLHDVGTHGVIVDLVAEALRGSVVRVCLHSYSGTADTLRVWLRELGADRVYVSLSYCINMARKMEETHRLLQVAPRHSVLTETDYIVDTGKPGLLTDLERVYSLLEDQWQVTSPECESIVENNYIKFIG